MAGIADRSICRHTWLESSTDQSAGTHGWDRQQINLQAHSAEAATHFGEVEARRAQNELLTLTEVPTGEH